MDKRQLKRLEIKPEDLERIARRRFETESQIKVDDELLLEAEFAMAYGWEAKENAMDMMPLDVMVAYVKAARKIEARQHLNFATDAFIGAAAAQSENAGKAFETATSSYREAMKADI